MSKVSVNWGRLPADKTVNLYIVKNTSRKYLYILSENEKTALSIAWSANHIYSTITDHLSDNGRSVWVVSDRPKDLVAHWNYIQQAIAERVQGTIELYTDSINVGDEVFS